MGINEKIKEVRDRIKYLSQHFPYTEDEINILTLCYIAIAAIDNDITDLLDELFSRVFILFNNGQFNEALINAEGKGILRYLGMHIKDGDYEYAIINQYKIPHNEYYTNYLFDDTIHEIKHSLNCLIKSHIVNERGEKLIYSGLSVHPDVPVWGTHSSYILDESFNCFVTRIYLQQLAYLRSNDEIKDPEIKKILRSFNPNLDGILWSCGTTGLLNNLFMDEESFRLFYNAALFRDLSSLYKFLSSIIGVDEAHVEEHLTRCLVFYNTQRYINRELQQIIWNINSKCPRKILEIKPSFKNI